MNKSKRCTHCKHMFRPNPRVKNQRYCGRKECQRARKTLWQKQKLASDPDYQANQRDSQRNWSKNHPGYWRNYRSRNPEYVKANRMLQKIRNTKRSPKRMIAKMDASKPDLSIKAGTYFIVAPPPPGIAKMDALYQKVHIIPTG